MSQPLASKNGHPALIYLFHQRVGQRPGIGFRKCWWADEGSGAPFECKLVYALVLLAPFVEILYPRADCSLTVEVRSVIYLDTYQSDMY